MNCSFSNIKILFFVNSKIIFKKNVKFKDITTKWLISL